MSQRLLRAFCTMFGDVTMPDTSDCWKRLLSKLQAGDVDDETPAEHKPFTAKSENGGIAIYLGTHRWRVVSKEDFDEYFEWFDYCAKHNFDRASRNEMKGKIKDTAESSSYIFALIKHFCKN